MAELLAAQPVALGFCWCGRRYLKIPYLEERIDVSNSRNKVWNKRQQLVLNVYRFWSVPEGKNKQRYTAGDAVPAALTLGTKESQELAPIPSPHLLMYSKSSLISGDACR